MAYPGNPGRILKSIIGFLAMIGFVLLLGTAGLSQQTVPKGSGIEGFRELRWGTSIEQSSVIYPDLSFEKYVISDSKEEPWKVYVRRLESGEIENVSFDSIEYLFKGNHFHKIRAILNSRIGPRTMFTRAENAFEKMSSRLKNKYGEPSGHKVDYVTEFIVVVKEATWDVNHSIITIKYEGAGKTNEDLFILTMQEKRPR